MSCSSFQCSSESSGWQLPQAEGAGGVMTNHQHPAVLWGRSMMLMVGVSSPQSQDCLFSFSQAASCSLAVPPAPRTQGAVVCQAVTAGGWCHPLPSRSISLKQGNSSHWDPVPGGKQWNPASSSPSSFLSISFYSVVSFSPVGMVLGHIFLINLGFADLCLDFCSVSSLASAMFISLSDLHIFDTWSRKTSTPLLDRKMWCP